MFEGIVEILYFVPDRLAAARWYAQLAEREITYLDSPDAFLLRIGSQDVWFHLADEKMPVGAAGQVAYWRVEALDRTIERAQRLGAELYRGPLKRLDGLFMAQLKDPFGNVFGIIGP